MKKITLADVSQTKEALEKAKKAIDQAIDLIERFDQATDDLEKIIADRERDWIDRAFDDFMEWKCTFEEAILRYVPRNAFCDIGSARKNYQTKWPWFAGATRSNFRVAIVENIMPI